MTPEHPPPDDDSVRQMLDEVENVVQYLGDDIEALKAELAETNRINAVLVRRLDRLQDLIQGRDEPPQ